MTPVTVQHDLKAQRFYAGLPDGSEAELQYRQEGKTLDFFHTYVPEAFRTEGIAEQVVQAGFEYAKREELRVIPSCPYISRGFLPRHPEFQDLV